MKIIILTLSITINILLAQENTLKKNYGIGFDFHMIPQILMENPNPGGYWEPNEIENIMGVYFSYETPTGLLIEPGYSFHSIMSEIDYDGSSDNDYEYTYTWSTASLGVFKINQGEDVRIYYGARVGKSWFEYDTDNDNDEDTELDNFMIAPTFGAEYFVGKNFSFGGEVMYKIVTIENNEWDDYDITTSTTTVEPKFLVRFYF